MGVGYSYLRQVEFTAVICQLTKFLFACVRVDFSSIAVTSTPVVLNVHCGVQIIGKGHLPKTIYVKCIRTEAKSPKSAFAESDLPWRRLGETVRKANKRR